MISSSSFIIIIIIIIIIILFFIIYYVIIIFIHHHYTTTHIFLYIIIIDNRSVHCCQSYIALHSKCSEQRCSASANDQQAPLTSKVLGLIDF